MCNGAGGGRLVIAGGSAQIYNLSRLPGGVGGLLIAPVRLNIAPEHFPPSPSLNVLKLNRNECRRRLSKCPEIIHCCRMLGFCNDHTAAAQLGSTLYSVKIKH